MKVLQIIESVSYGDGASNCMMYLRKTFNEHGIQNAIAARRIDGRLRKERFIQFYDTEELDIREDVILLYHFCSGCDLNYDIEHLACRKILVYHNVTPGFFFRGYDNPTMLGCLWGEMDAKSTVGNYRKAIVLSEFSKNVLVSYGWDEKDITVIPIIANGGTAARPDEAVMGKYADGKKNFLFVGRVVPNKKHEDAIRIFDHYKKEYNKDCRLFFVGNRDENGLYYKALRYYIERHRIEGIEFTGHVTDEELAAYYSVADAFLCMSEHEGLCLPVLEAMKWKVPVVAYRATAIPDTMGGTGILLDTKDEKTVCDAVERLFENKGYREQIVNGQSAWQKSYNLESHEKKLLGLLRSVEKAGDICCRFKSAGIQRNGIKYIYSLGDRLVFTASGQNASAFCLGGFYFPEDWGTWTGEGNAVMKFLLSGEPAGDLDLEMDFRIFDGRQEFEILVNRRHVAEMNVSGEEAVEHVTIPREYLDKRNILVLTFRFKTAVSPAEIGVSDDERKLAIGMKSLMVSDAGGAAHG